MAGAGTVPLPGDPVPAPLVCANCKKPPNFIWVVSLEGWEAVEIVREKGEIKVRDTGERDADWGTADREVLECQECHKTYTDEEKAVVEQPIYECHGCGWVGADINDHREDCDDNPEPMVPIVPIHEGQEQLAI